MPSRRARGKGAGVAPLGAAVGWQQPTFRGSPSRRGTATIIESLESRTLLSTSWFVASYGSDTNPGTIALPFKTIQKAADIATAGDHVEIRAGIYRETVAPKHSGSLGAPIVFEAYNGEDVTLSGADPVTNWANSQGSIYTASMPWDLGFGRNQVFVDGQMINEARWPNTTLDLSHPTLATAQSVDLGNGIATIHDPALTQPAGFWQGATIHIATGRAAWIAQTGSVISSAPGQLSYSFQFLDNYQTPHAGDAYYLTGNGQALDAPGEWFRDDSGTLSVWMPAGDSPALHDVEVKNRPFGFDLTSRHLITIANINFFACTINTDAASVGTVINHINAKYTGHFVLTLDGWHFPNDTGIILNGPYSVLENSTVQYSAGDGVLVNGDHSQVSNNVFHDIDYSASDAAAVRVLGASVVVDHNTIYDCGRSGIFQQGTGLKILYNTIYNVGLQTTEAGGIYTIGVDGGGSEIAFNKIYGFHSGGFGQTALFFDNNSNNYVVHDNQTWDVDEGLKMNGFAENNNVYNNTLSGSWWSVYTDQKGDWNGSTFANNVLIDKYLFNIGVTSKNNVRTSGPGVGAADVTSGAGTDPVQVSNDLPADALVGLPPDDNGPPPDPGGVGGGTGGSSPPPTTAEGWAAQVLVDRGTIKSAQQQLVTNLHALTSTLRADAVAYRAALRQLRLASRGKTVTPSSGGSGTSADLSQQVDQLRLAIQNDRSALASARQSGLAAVLAARQQLAADLKSLRLAKKHKGKSR